MGTDSEAIRGRNGSYTLSAGRPFAFGRVSVLYEGVAASGDVVCAKIFKKSRGSRESSGMDEFLRELEAQERLRHPHILPVLDFGRNGEGEPFVVYPLCRGGDLRRLLGERSYVPFDESLTILDQVASAIDFAHAQGFIHGDVKPENILFESQRRQAYLADFGASKHFPIVGQISTAVGKDRAGTTAYLSPEQLADDKQSARSDIYSFGIVAYEMLTGKLPFDVNAPLFRQISSKLEGTLLDPIDAHPGIRSSAADGLRAALRVDRTQRPQSATEFCAIIRGTVAVRHVEPAAGRAKSTWQSLDGTQRAAIIAAAIAALGGVITAIVTLLPELLKLMN